MNKEIQNNNNTPEEVDLGQLFSLIERLFKKLGEFIVKIFKFLLLLIEKLGVLILIILNVLKRNFIKIGILCALVFVFFFLMNKYSDKEYKSNMVVSQNFTTGRLLYTTISRLDGLAKKNDSLAISKELNIPIKTASKIKGFRIKDFMNQNQLERDYYEMMNTKDSLKRMSIEDYESQIDYENFPAQSITIFAESTDIYNSNLSNAIIKMFESNVYYNEERLKTIDIINDKLVAYQSMLEKSETLQNEYVSILKSYYNISDTSKGMPETNLNVNLNNTKEKVDTKEFDLLEDQKSIKLEIATLKAKLENNKSILRLQKGFSEAISVDNFYKENRNAAIITVFIILMLLYLIKEFNVLGFINQHGIKERLSKESKWL
ncbi:hypothetical protein [Psychroserpens mesophilus]|uniref:hypothetical protein n=1 Tax=Psychroserpens mesophilus TaxID=325473 RepID=UPI003D64D855